MELALDNRHDFAGAVLPIGQQLQDAPPHRIAQDVERVHEAGYSAAGIVV